jgi:hypothetical protein
MAEENAVESAAEQVTDFMFGKEAEQQVEAEPEDTPEGDDYEPDPEPVVEGEEAEPEVEAKEPEEDAPEVVELEWDGELIEAPKSVAEALMRNKDYTEKTQEIATQRKELEIRSEGLRQLQAQSEFANSIQNEVLEIYTAQMEVKNLTDYLEANARELGAQDFQTVQVELKKRERVIAEKSAELQQKHNEHQQAVEQSRKELRDKSTEVLRQKVPGWNDKSEQDIREYALSQGIPEQLYNTVVDPTEKLILYKAMRYDHAKANSGKAVKTVQDAPTIKPKSRNPMPKQVGDKLNLRKKLKSSNRSATQKKRDMEDFMASRFKI